jgi:hypothetical protein
VLRYLLAHLYAISDRAPEARHALAELSHDGFTDLPRDNEWLFSLSFLPEVCEAVADTRCAERLYALLEPFADRTACDVDEGDTGSLQRPLGLLAAQLGMREQAIAHLATAVERNDALGYRPWSAWSRFALGGLLGGVADARGEALLEHARATARELGMTALSRAADDSRS